MMNSVIQPLREWLAKCNTFIKSFVRQNALPLISSVLLFILVILFFFDRTVISIQSGQRGVLWRWLGAGTVIDTVYPEGVHLILPFNKMFIYNIRKQQFSDAIDVLTVDGLTVRVKYTVRYYLEPATLPLLHQYVGPDFVNVAIRPDVRSVVRTLFGQYKPEEIYTSQKAIQLLFSEKSKVHLAARFVKIDDVPIESITLPASISKAIEEKMVQQQREGEYVYRLSIAQKEADRLQIESEGIRIYNETVNKSLTASVLKWEGIRATRELAKSSNAKVVVIGSGQSGLPIILGKD
ncbi:prohibitin family protein [Chlorobium sp. BLA1]|uniref:prohibitin family protein n=1 Tax=Candidatus Chlorobium masyuteum TaxID=2716876 RepID=UPI001423479F|nr:prohibitin family protein [Candidatus Chlorobium masyuteum]NHQ60390.1 prohibitin family protein [Candidatus Chlorobium masyuteum]NTU44035.1 prohibitin family protein [Chlorobiaceae bacterium]